MAPHSTVHSQALSPAVRRAILLFSLATFSSMTAQRICDAMLPELSRTFGVSLAQAAQVVSMFALSYGVAQWFFGPLGDRLGKFRVITLTTLVCAAGNLLAVFAISLNQLVLARIFVGAAAAAIIPLTLAWVGDAVEYKLRQETLARVGLGTTLGITGGQLAGGLFADTLGWRWAFGYMTLLFAAVGFLLLLEGRRQRREQASGAPVAMTSSGGSAWAQTLEILRDRWVRTVLTVSLLEGAVGFGVLAIWASHLHGQRGLSLALAGSVVALYGLGGMGYMAGARFLVPRLGEVGLARFGVRLLAGSALVVAWVPGVAPAVLACAIGGFGFFMFHNTMQVNATQMAPQARGTGVALFASALFMGQSLGVLLAAALAERVGSAWVITGGALILLTLGSGFARAVARRQRQELASST